MKIVLTGGAGFIGSHLTDKLLAEGHEVIIIDNLLTGSLNNIKQHEGNPKLRFIEHDISDSLDIKEKVDFVLHFASPASPVDYLKHPLETMEVGSLGTFNTLEMALKHKAKYLMASTSEIYGDPAVSPQKEDYWGNVNTIGPRSVYDEAKRFSEALVMAYNRTHHLNTRIVRIFNTYGPRMQKDDGRAVPNFVNQALRGEKLTIFGDGKQTRSFCFVSDLVEGLYKLMLSEEHQPVNLGNPNEFTILELAQKVLKILDSKTPLTFKPLPQDDPKQRRPDISKAKKILDWEPKINLDEGLQKTIAWFKQA
ncbi:SDR family oxidoreductase [Candidatus Saganbacteria bacterium]|nr:SDR family oxidoreductase [Candidatus Saganbacteria bacterium]